MPVGGKDVTLGEPTRSNCVYTAHDAAAIYFRPCLEITCRFSRNLEDATVGLSINIVSACSGNWFIPSFANALDWNKPVLAGLADVLIF